MHALPSVGGALWLIRFHFDGLL